MFATLTAVACGALVWHNAAATPSQAADATPETVRVDSCSWDRPGANPYMGDVVKAVDRYQDIPAPVRARLKDRMAKRSYDDLVSIRRDSIEGRGSYAPAIRDMHFGTNRVCGTVARKGWTGSMQERGLVYCESGHCILVPTVCRNVSRIARRPQGVASQPVAAASDELSFDPPAAGPASGPTAVASDGVVGGGGGATPVSGPITFAQASTRSDPPPYLPPVSLPPSDPPPSWDPPKWTPPVGIPPISVPPSAVTPPVPEPETVSMMLLGGALLGAMRWRAVRRQRRRDEPNSATQNRR